MLKEAVSSKQRTAERVSFSGIRTRQILPDAFNAVRISVSHDNISGDDSFVLLARKINNSLSPQPVDYSSLVLYNYDGSPIGSFRPPTPSDITNLEDPRAVLNGKRLGEGGEVVIGLTAVKEHPTSWHAAIITAKLGENGDLEPTSPLFVMRDSKAKNATPLYWDPESRSVTFFSRRDDADTKHELLLEKINMDTGEVEKLKIVTIPNLPWNAAGIGTVGAPIEINGRKILFIHGRREEANGVGIKTIYSLGAVEMDQEWNVTAITPNPLIERFHLPAGELRPDDGRLEAKEVVYSTDNPTLINESGELFIELAVSYGDRGTVMATLPVQHLISQLQPTVE